MAATSGLTNLLSGENYRAVGRFRKLGAYLRRYAGHLAAAVAALVVAAVSMLAIGSALRWMIDEGIARGGAGVSVPALAAIGAIVVTQAVAGGLRTYLLGWVGARVAADLRNDVFGHLLELEPQFFEDRRNGDILSRVTVDSSVLQMALAGSMGTIVHSVVLLIGGAFFLATTSVYLTFITVLGLPPLLLVLLFFGGRLRLVSREAQRRVGNLSAYLQEILSGIRLVRAYGNEAFHRAESQARVLDVFRGATRSLRTRSLMVGALMLAIYASLGAIIWLGGRALTSGSITAGELSAFVFYAVIVASALSAGSEALGQMYQGAGAADRLFDLLDVRPTLHVAAAPVPLPVPGRGEVALREVTFRYPGATGVPPALEGVSLVVHAGERVALVGPSGAGKSTIFSLLLRFFDPDEGAVLLDGVDLRAADPREVRRRLGIVQQEPFIFSGTLADNVRYGRLDATRAEVERAVEAAQLAGFVATLPDGLDTPVGERGARLSGGQRQRVAIARAILRAPRLLLLDEATSALDAESEQAVQRAIEAASAGRTSIVIAHRLATVVNADRIIVMDGGRVVGSGTHAGLLGTNALYARLCELQFALPRRMAAQAAPSNI